MLKINESTHYIKIMTMKFLQVLSAGMLLLFFTACSTTKSTGNKENLFNNTWELEFISGPPHCV